MRTYGDENIRCAQAEVETSCQDLLGLLDSSKHSEHQSCLVNQLVLIQGIWNGPLQCSGYRNVEGDALNLKVLR